MRGGPAGVPGGRPPLRGRTAAAPLHPTSSAGESGQVLWGRLIALGVVCLVVFLFGLGLGVRAGSDAETIAEQEEAIDELVAELRQMEEQLEALRAGSDAGDDDQDETAETDQTDGQQADDGAGVPEGGVYEVGPDDTLYSIALEVYGDGTRWEVIAEANDLEDQGQLRSGMQLEIPELDD